MSKKNLIIISFLILIGLLKITPVQAAEIEIKNSVVISSTSYHLIYHEISGNQYLLTAGGEDGLLIYQMTEDGLSSDPVGTFDTDGSAMDVTAYGNYAYVADHYTQNGPIIKGHLLTLDISDPANPQLVNDYQVTLGNFQTVAISADGSTLYAGDKISGIHILDVSDPTTPIFLSSYSLGSAAADLAVVDTTLYILQIFDTAGGILVVDFSNPTAPTALGGESVYADANELTVAGSVVYVANGATGLTAYDFSNPASPTLLSNFDTGGSARAFAVLNPTTGVIADGSGGVYVIATANTSALAERAQSSDALLTSATDVVVVDGRIFVLSAGIQELTLTYTFSAQGSGNGAEEAIAVKDGSAAWCTIDVSDQKVGAKVFLGDYNNDGLAYEIAEAPIGKIKKPKIRVYDAVSCELLSQKKMSDSDKKQQFKMKGGNYYGSDTSQDEIVATRVFTKDDVPQIKLLAYFLNTSNELKLKKSTTFATNKKMESQGYKLQLTEGKKWPIVIKAKNDTSVQEKYKLEKKDGNFKWKKKQE